MTGGPTGKTGTLVAKDDESVAMLQYTTVHCTASVGSKRMHIVRARAVELDWMSLQQGNWCLRG